jgi:hypothetical protein
MPIEDPNGNGFTRNQAISILCRVVARWAEQGGAEGDAWACRVAETVLLREPSLCERCRCDLTAQRAKGVPRE